MLIVKFERLRDLYNEMVEAGEIYGYEMLRIGEMVKDAEELINNLEDYELFYRVNKLMNLLNELEKEL